ncbi:MAG TPA: sigma-70 family RNA polymerase sigma factor [Bryobacteraceae bacterium]|jgi:RNA polymerase sigma factor (TIGR02999 family)
MASLLRVIASAQQLQWLIAFFGQTMGSPPEKITGLLKAWSEGDPAAQEQLIPLVYHELRHLASHYRRRAGGGDTLRTTALVHEAYLRLVDIDNVDWRDRVHFFAVSAQLMRRILVDAARAHGAAKRGGGARLDSINVDELPAPGSDRAAELIALDDALTALAKLDPRRTQVIELRVFGGLTVDETAAALDLSPQTVMRDWKLAKAWLLRELSRSSS